MNFQSVQIVQSAQVWVCESCGTQDHKSCSCNSPARMEMLAAKREQDRQRQRRHREKINENNASVTRDTDIENIEENGAKEMKAAFAAMDEPDEPGDDDQTIWRRGLIFRAQSARTGAEFENWSRFVCDRQLVKEARAAADAWNKLAKYLEELCNGKQTAA